MTKKNFAIYVDQDGCLARWRNVPVWVTKLPLYFLFLRREKKLVRLVKSLDAQGFDVRILTKAYEDTWAAQEKMVWLKLVGLNVPVIIVPYGESKLNYVEDNGLLIDDFTPNLREWVATGRPAVKFRNRINGRHKTWQGPFISYKMTVHEMQQVIFENMKEDNYDRCSAVN